jgi:hypothetical protein
MRGKKKGGRQGRGLAALSGGLKTGYKSYE